MTTQTTERVPCGECKFWQLQWWPDGFCCYPGQSRPITRQNDSCEHGKRPGPLPAGWLEME